MNPMFRMWRCYFSGLLDAGRWRMFLHSRMWLGLPVAAVAAFVVIFLLRRFGESLPTAEALWKGAVCALVIAFCWALGVWAAVGPEPSDDDGGQDGEAVGDVGARAAWRQGALLRIAAGGVRPGLLVPDFGNAGRRMFAGPRVRGDTAQGDGGCGRRCSRMA